MGWSDLSYRGRSLHANDVDLAVWLHFAVRAIDAEDHRPVWLDAIREDWSIQSTGGFGFGVTPDLDRHVTDDRRATMLSLFRRAAVVMDEHDDVMTADELNDLQAAGPDAVFAGDLSMELFRRVARGAVALLEGRDLG